MPATALTVQTMTRSGVVATNQLSDETNGNSIRNDLGELFVRMKNTDVSARTVTFTADRADNDGNTVDAQITIEASEVRMIGPFKDRARWGGGDRLLQSAYSAGTGVTMEIEVFQYPFQDTEAATK